MLGNKQTDVERVKANIGDSFTEKTASYICQLLETFDLQTIFGRVDAQNVLGLKTAKSTELPGEMTERGFIEPVKGL